MNVAELHRLLVTARKLQDQRAGLLGDYDYVTGMAHLIAEAVGADPKWHDVIVTVIVRDTPLEAGVDEIAAGMGWYPPR